MGQEHKITPWPFTRLHLPLETNCIGSERILDKKIKVLRFWYGLIKYRRAPEVVGVFCFCFVFWGGFFLVNL